MICTIKNDERVPEMKTINRVWCDSVFPELTHHGTEENAFQNITYETKIIDIENLIRFFSLHWYYVDRQMLRSWEAR